jgi:hypothetical protein
LPIRQIHTSVIETLQALAQIERERIRRLRLKAHIELGKCESLLLAPAGKVDARERASKRWFVDPVERQMLAAEIAEDAQGQKNAVTAIWGEVDALVASQIGQCRSMPA